MDTSAENTSTPVKVSTVELAQHVSKKLILLVLRRHHASVSRDTEVMDSFVRELIPVKPPTATILPLALQVVPTSAVPVQTVCLAME